MSRMSIGGYVWKAILERRFVVSATVGDTEDAKVGQYATFDEAAEVARDHQDARIVNALSGEDLTHLLTPAPSCDEEPASPGPR